MAQKAKNLNEASLVLDGYMELDPRDEENFITYYVDRFSPIDNLIREANRARQHQRNFCWLPNKTSLKIICRFVLTLAKT